MKICSRLISLSSRTVPSEYLGGMILEFLKDCHFGYIFWGFDSDLPANSPHLWPYSAICDQEKLYAFS